MKPVLLLAALTIIMEATAQSMRVPCPVIRIENGRVKLRSRGVVAKFRCRRNFLMIEGDRFVTCSSLGVWRGTIPKCIGSGCGGNLEVAHGRSLLMFGDALAQFECDPGYELHGSAALSCNSRRWNDSIPTCEAPIETPYSCDFESRDICGWTIEQMYPMLWRRSHGPASVQGAGTRPRTDHTLRNTSGHYLYMDGTSHAVWESTSRLYSPVLQPLLSSPACVTIWASIQGPNTGYLNVYLKPVTEDLDVLVAEESLTGHQGPGWKLIYISLQDMDEPFQVVVEVVWGNGYMSDIAVDDFLATSGIKCFILESHYIAQDFTTISTAATTSLYPSRFPWTSRPTNSPGRTSSVIHLTTNQLTHSTPSQALSTSLETTTTTTTTTTQQTPPTRVNAVTPSPPPHLSTSSSVPTIGSTTTLPTTTTASTTEAVATHQTELRSTTMKAHQATTTTTTEIALTTTTTARVPLVTTPKITTETSRYITPRPTKPSTSTWISITPKTTDDTPVMNEMKALEKKRFSTLMGILLVSLGVAFLVSTLMLIYQKCVNISQLKLSDDSDIKYLQQADDDSNGVGDSDSLVYHPKSSLDRNVQPQVDSSTSTSVASSIGSNNSDGSTSIRKPVRPSPPVPSDLIVQLDDSSSQVLSNSPVFSGYGVQYGKPSTWSPPTDEGPYSWPVNDPNMKDNLLDPTDTRYACLTSSASASPEPQLPSANAPPLPPRTYGSGTQV